jgi:dsDNA-specific endonuclease/ATPase MutS2
MNDMNDIVDSIMQMDSDDIEHVVNAVRSRREMLSIKAKAQFRIGDRVKFFSRRNQEEVEGTVLKINRKKIVVSVGAISWTVPPTMLERVDNG